MSLYVNGVPQYTNLADYIEPARCAIEFWDLAHLELKYSYDSFDVPTSGALVTQCIVSPPGISSAGSFRVVIDDTEKSLDFDITRRANVVVVKAKKYESQDWLNLIYGVMKSCQPTRPGGNQLMYSINGVGTGAILSDRIVNMQKISNPSTAISATPDPYLNDINMQTNNLFKDLLQNVSNYVVQDVTLQSQLGMSDDTADLLDASPVKTKIISLNQKYVTASTALQSMLDSIGADGGINSYNEPYLKWPNSQLSGITLKTWDDAVAGQGLDLANKNSYFVDPFSWEITWDKSDGFINRYISQAQTRIIVGGNATAGSGNFNTNGFVSLNKKDYALQIDPQQTRIQNLAIVVEKKGLGTTDPENIKSIHGHIIEDIADSPTGQIVAYWDIPLDRVPVNVPTAMFLTDIVFTGNGVINSEKKYWITTYNRGDSLDNTINWYTVPTPDGVISNIASRVIAKGLPWAIDHNIVNGWEVSLDSPNMLAFSIFDNYKHDIVAEDTESQDRYGLVEEVIQSPFPTSPIATHRYLDALLQLSALPKMTTDAGTVTIPNDLFMPGILINIEDKLSGISPSDNFQAEIPDLTYEFGGSEDTALGSQYVKVTPLGYYNWRLESTGF